MINFLVVLLTLSVSITAFANPYPDKDMVPKNDPAKVRKQLPPARPLSQETLEREGQLALRVRVDWIEGHALDASSERYIVGNIVRERSGTSALLARSAKTDPLGSYKGVLLDAATGQIISNDSVGTGQEYRRLTRAISFRFPLIERPVRFQMYAENPVTGTSEKVLDQQINPAHVTTQPPFDSENLPDVQQLKPATQEPKLLVNIYADGYLESARSKFFNDARKVVSALIDNGFPMVENFEFRAVFSPSLEKLGSAQDLGLPVIERKSALGLYYPYWRKFGRWYNVVYPTSEEKFRAAIGRVPYDYAIALLDNAEYWGVGNYKELTAIPSDDPRFDYLMTHEFGHFFGLNEEYEGGGPTELAFAPGITEPWSQNITFLYAREFVALKWKAFAKESTPLPTADSYWNPRVPLYGAYEGGYGDTEPFHRSHKPGKSCVMERYPNFCPICQNALRINIRQDLGL